MNSFHTSSFKVLVIIIVLITVFSCGRKPETIFNINEQFEKIVSIPLEEVEEMPVFIFTDFGFYAFENLAMK